MLPCSLKNFKLSDQKVKFDMHNKQMLKQKQKDLLGKVIKCSRILC